MPIRTHQELLAFLVIGGVVSSLSVVAERIARAGRSHKETTDLLSRCLADPRAALPKLPPPRGHRPDAIRTYEESRLFAGAIRRATQEKSKPPWFADSHVGQFSNDPSLRPEEIGALAARAEAKSPAGDTKDARPSWRWAESWSIPKADLVLKMTQAVALPASGDIEYTYQIVPTNFKEDHWVQMAEAAARAYWCSVHPFDAD
jgi:hypothetical protein